MNQPTFPEQPASHRVADPQARKPAVSELRKLGRLTTLPVFLQLDGKRVVVAGGTDAAAWKAELAAASGARVTVYAAAPGEEMAALLRRGAAAGALELAPRPWDTACLMGAALAICDADTSGEAAAFACAARAAGVPCNVVDRPEHSAVQFGAIVNRSPVVVGVSTNGAAPILSQVIRRRIEALLPPTLGAWGALAAKVRALAGERLSPGRQRRTFWERFSELALGRHPPPPVDQLLDEAAAVSRRGKVTLVGAGPGDAGLMTLHAVRALQSCDVILFDDLVSADVLDLARREAKRVAVGKRGARASCRQEDIIALMIDLALSGQCVVRLKSGDPMIFGRAGEEIAALRKVGVEVDVVPGITSASAMAARLGASLTHRDHAQVVSFVTGHSRRSDVAAPSDVAAVIAMGHTAIVYMGAGTSATWVEKAIAGGVPSQMPAAAAAAVTWDTEALWTGALADLPQAIGGLGEGPILIGVGAVFDSARGVARAGQSAAEPAASPHAGAMGAARTGRDEARHEPPPLHRSR